MNYFDTMARNKGLKVHKNMFGRGWCITLPNGATYNALTDADKNNFIKGY